MLVVVKCRRRGTCVCADLFVVLNVAVTMGSCHPVTGVVGGASLCCTRDHLLTG
jgi:hypothetical protein